MSVLTRAQLLQLLHGAAVKGSVAGDIMDHDAALRTKADEFERSMIELDRQWQERFDTLRTQLEEYKSAIEVIQSSRDICLNTFTAWAKDEYGPAKMALRKLPEVEQRNAALVEALRWWVMRQWELGWHETRDGKQVLVKRAMKDSLLVEQALASGKED